jgi:hypothetical protein
VAELSAAKDELGWVDRSLLQTLNIQFGGPYNQRESGGEKIGLHFFHGSNHDFFQTIT